MNVHILLAFPDIRNTWRKPGFSPYIAIIPGKVHCVVGCLAPDTGRKGWLSSRKSLLQNPGLVSEVDNMPETQNIVLMVCHVSAAPDGSRVCRWRVAAQG